MPLVNLIGTLAFALSGYLVGVRKKLDLLGIGVLATLTAVGGGMMRDVLLVRRPLVFTSSAQPFMDAPFVIIVTVLVAFIARVHRLTDKRARWLFQVSDSMGLVAFAMAGADAAAASHTNLFGTMLLAFITAVGGGLVRDALVNDVPAILSEDVYGTIAILIGLGVGLLNQFGVDHRPFMPLFFVVGLSLRLTLVVARARLPRVQ